MTDSREDWYCCCHPPVLHPIRAAWCLTCSVAAPWMTWQVRHVLGLLYSIILSGERPGSQVDAEYSAAHAALKRLEANRG